MKHLFDPERVQEVTGRIAQLTPASTPQWGKMNVAQMLAHCAVGIETAVGEKKPPRPLVGRILGPIVKPLVLRNDDPMRKNTPTAPVFMMEGDRDFTLEKARLNDLVERFGAAWPAGCTDHPHVFFGKLKPDEWAVLTYKHLDHHLRQFGV